MSKKIALVNLRYKIDISFEHKESLALGYLASTLIHAGHEVDIIDAQFFNLEVEEVHARLTNKAYDLIGFSVYQETANAFTELHTRLLQSPTQAHITLGGQFPTFTPELLLKKYALVDSIVLGEGELTLLELVSALPDGQWKNVAGLCYLEAGKMVRSSPRKLIQDLNQLPPPYRETYYANLENPDTISAIISASRGCYAHCSFCSIQTFYGTLKGKRIRIRQPENVVDEIEDLYHRYKIRNFFFADDNFLVVNLIHKSWLNTFMDELERRQLSIQFDMDCRVNDIDVDLFKRLKRNGLNGVFLGIESFNQRSLDTLKKDATVKQNIDAIKILRKLRVNVWMGFIMFDMFTTLDEIKVDVAALDEIKYFKYMNYDRPLSSDWLASTLQLYNGTPVLDMMKREHPNLLIQNEFGFGFEFQHEKTQRFHTQLKKWKQTVKKMIQIDTLWLIRQANAKAKRSTSATLHQLSRKYMALDRHIFLSLLNTIEANQDHRVDDIIQSGETQFNQIASQIMDIRNELQATQAFATP